jgi:HAD superfamily hydrolase (TIGR01509 family)
MSRISPKAIVFDLVGVLFFINKIRVLRSLDSKDLIFYYLKKGKNPIDEGIMLLDKMRQEVPGQFQEIVAYKGTYLPTCFLAWNQGLISRDETFEQIQNYFNDLEKQNYFTNENHKRVILNLLKKLFSSKLGVEAYKPVRSTVELVKKLKKTNNYKLYILSNIDKETFEGMHILHKSIFDLFDGIVTSCYSNFLKPDVAIFEYLIKNYNLDPLDCCFIDDQLENVQAAEKIGMQIIHCVRPSKLPTVFKQKGIL